MLFRAEQQQSSTTAGKAAGRSRRPGWVLNIIVQVLACRGEPMHIKDVHAAEAMTIWNQPPRWRRPQGAYAAQPTRGCLGRGA
jgi:hypothetical protein